MDNKLENNKPPIKVSEEDIDNSTKELSYAIASTENPDDVDSLVQKFRLNDIKKEVFNTVKYREVLDTINKEAAARITNRPSEISNKELLDYMNAYQNQLDRAQKNINGVKDINAVQVNNTQNNTVNIHVGDEKIDSLSKTSRDKITDLIAEILKESNKTPASSNIPGDVDSNKTEIIDVIPDDESEGDE